MSNLSFPVFGGPTIGAVLCFDREDDVISKLISVPEFVNVVVCIDLDETGAITSSLNNIAEQDLRISVVSAKKDRDEGISEALQFALDAGSEVVIGLLNPMHVNFGMLELLAAPVLDGDADCTKGQRTPSPLDKNATLGGFSNALSDIGMKFACGYWSVEDLEMDVFAIQAEVLRKFLQAEGKQSGTFEQKLLIHLGMSRARLSEFPISSQGNAKPSKPTLSISNCLKIGLNRSKIATSPAGIVRLSVLLAAAIAAIVLLPLTSVQTGFSSVILSPSVMLLALCAYVMRSLIKADQAAEPVKAIHPYLRVERRSVSPQMNAGLKKTLGRQAAMEEMILLHSLEKTIH